MESWTVTREPEKPKTVKGKNELLRQRAKELAARLDAHRLSLNQVGTMPYLGSALSQAVGLLEELTEALKP